MYGYQHIRWSIVWTNFYLWYKASVATFGCINLDHVIAARFVFKDSNPYLELVTGNPKSILISTKEIPSHEIANYFGIEDLQEQSTRAENNDIYAWDERIGIEV